MIPAISVPGTKKREKLLRQVFAWLSLPRQIIRKIKSEFSSSQFGGKEVPCETPS